MLPAAAEQVYLREKRGFGFMTGPGGEMTTSRLSRRGVLVLAGAALTACAIRPSGPRPFSTETLEVPVEGGRTMSLRVLRPAEVVGVVLFSHGGGGSPDNYGPLLTAWAEAGWLVLAPVHSDSTLLPAKRRATLQAALPLRMAEMRAASALAARQAPGEPVAAAGHSYGSVFAGALGGALADRGGVRDPAVRAVVMLSSPGVQPGLITPRAYATLATPLLLMTGDADVVPGMVPDWRSHLVPFETSPAGGKLALVRRGGDHEFGLRDPRASAVAKETADAALLFLRAHALGDTAARRALAALASTEAIEVRRR